MTMHISDDDLHDYAGGELPLAAMDVVALHLEGCAECRARAEPLLALTARLAVLPRAADPAVDGWPALHARLANLSAATETAAPVAAPVTKVVSLDAHRARRGALRAWVPQAAAAVLLLGLGFSGGRLSGSPDGRQAMLVAADTVATAMAAAWFHGG